MNILFFIVVTLLAGFILFCSVYDHLLSALLRLEFIVLSVYVVFLIGMGVTYYFYSLFYLTIAACEGALGLSILVIISRTHGGDYLKIFNLL